MVLASKIARNVVGNKIDRAACFYVLCNGQRSTFRKWKTAVLGSDADYPDKLFLPASDYPQAQAQWPKLSWSHRFALWWRITIAMFWESPLSSKALVQNYVKDIVDRHLKDVPFDRESLRDTICVYLRCSDIPHNRVPSYHLYRVSWYVKAIKRILAEQDYSSILIVSCNSHNQKSALRRKACTSWVDTYEDAFTKIFGLPIRRQCSNVMHDFATLRYAPALICPPSSFAYYAGLASDGVMITTCPSTEKDCLSSYQWSWHAHCSAFPLAKPSMIYIPPDVLWHEDVVSYDEAADVSTLLLEEVEDDTSSRRTSP